MKRDTLGWKIFITAVQVIGIGIAVAAVLLLLGNAGIAEEEYETMYAICQPGDRVNIRPFPNRNLTEGWLETGDEVLVDGRKRNGFIHCVGLNNESGEGWVHKGYLVWDKPERVSCIGTVISRGKLAARKNVGGKRVRWLKPGGTVKVYYVSDEWCVTNCGYVKTEFLELEDE